MKSLYGLVGMKHRGTEALIASLPNGEPLVLVREPDNKFDRFAVQVWARGQHVGFIKMSQVKPLALAMDANPAALDALGPAFLPLALGRTGKSAKLAIDGGKWPLVEVEE